MTMTTKSPINVLIVDDHNLVRTGIRRMLEEVPGIKVIGEADSGEAALKWVREAPPHVVLMDVKMPGIGGLEATRKLLRLDRDIRILVISACEDSVYPSRLLQAGAAGYVTKGASLDDVVHAIRCVHAGQRYVSPEIAQEIALKKLSIEGRTPFDDLSARELQVANLVVNGQRVPAISEKLHLSPKTVNSYRYRIFKKMGIKTDVELTHIALRHGLVDVPEVVK